MARQFKTPQDRINCVIRLKYKQFRRMGYPRGLDTLQKAREGAARLTAMFAVMEASDYTACPLKLAANAHAI